VQHQEDQHRSGGSRPCRRASRRPHSAIQQAGRSFTPFGRRAPPCFKQRVARRAKALEAPYGSRIVGMQIGMTLFGGSSECGLYCGFVGAGSYTEDFIGLGRRHPFACLLLLMIGSNSLNNLWL
jgi:hypothetical protein